jgi:hypothetical protein
MPCGWLARVIAAVLLLSVCPSIASADHGKVDRVQKTNGDVLTCEVTGLVRGLLTCETDGMGTVTIEWYKIVRLTSPAIFEVELSSGVRYFGALSSPADFKLAVSGAPIAMVFDFINVVRLVPLDKSFWRQLDGSIDVGYTFTQADQRSQWTLNGIVSRSTRKYFTSFTVNSLLTIEEGGTQQNRNTVAGAVQRKLGQRWFGVLFGQADQNEQLNLDFRGLGGVGFGRRIVQTNRVLLSPYAGVSYTQERFTAEPVQNRLEAALGVRLDWFTFGDYKSDLVFQEQTYFDTKDASKVRVELNTKFKQEIVKDLYWSINLLESFNAAPPAGNKKNDVTLSMSLGWSF